MQNEIIRPRNDHSRIDKLRKKEKGIPKLNKTLRQNKVGWQGPDFDDIKPSNA